MQEVRVTVPVERSAATARIAIDASIPGVSVYDIFVHGPEQPKRVVSVECSTPQAKAFIDALLNSPVFDLADCSLSSRELRALINKAPLGEITRPMAEPAPDVIEDLWQMSHVTPSYVARAAGGAILLADGVIHNSPFSIVIAALFLPFFPQVLAVGLGAHGAAIVASSAGAPPPCSPARFLAYGAGVIVAVLAGGPIAFQDSRVRSPVSPFPPSSASPRVYRR